MLSKPLAKTNNHIIISFVVYCVGMCDSHGGFVYKYANKNFIRMSWGAHLMHLSLLLLSLTASNPDDDSSCSIIYSILSIWIMFTDIFVSLFAGFMLLKDYGYLFVDVMFVVNTIMSCFTVWFNVVCSGYSPLRVASFNLTSIWTGLTFLWILNGICESRQQLSAHSNLNNAMDDGSVSVDNPNVRMNSLV